MVEKVNMTIDCPPNINKETAQQCFIIGLKTLMFLHNGNVVVSHLDEFNGEKNIKSMALANEDGASVIKFVEFLQNMNKVEFNEKIKIIEEKGNELIEENYKKKTDGNT